MIKELNMQLNCTYQNVSVLQSKPGVEPGPAAWEEGTLPLSYIALVIGHLIIIQILDQSVIQIPSLHLKQFLTYFTGDKLFKSCNPKNASHHQGLRWKKPITALHLLKLMVPFTPRLLVLQTAERNQYNCSYIHPPTLQFLLPFLLNCRTQFLKQG